VWLLVFLGLLWSAERSRALVTASAGAEEMGVPQRGGTAAGPEAPAVDPRRLADAALAAEETSGEANPLPGKADQRPEVPPIDVLELVKSGGLEMAAIILVSIVALAFALERFLALRRQKVVPPELMAGLERLARQKGGFDPGRADHLCRQHPSTAAAVVQAMLLKTGRPNSEVEQAVAEASERAASRLYANVRWQNLAFNVAPMLGLLGTIQGMIQAFFVTSHLPPNVSKAECLADGIYRALVNTFAGLAVAIPAAVFAHLLEGRILKLMGELDDVIRGILPQMERFEGRLQRAAAPGDRGDGQPSQPAPSDEVPTAPTLPPQPQ
jgi:biopolymer transport protein ExbB